jgi:hypothetical protein
MIFVPIYAQKHKTNLCFTQETCNYTTEGRKKIHSSLKAIQKDVLYHVMTNFIPNRTIEYNDNRISKFISQYGKCGVTGVKLGLSDWHCHHKIPFHLSIDDRFSNLIVLHESVHRLTHMKDDYKIMVALKELNLDNKRLDKVNDFVDYAN